MRVLRCIILCVAFVMGASPAFATPPVFNGSVKVPTGGSIDATANPIGLASGGIGAYAGPAPASGATLVFSGDSITFGYGINNQSTLGCSGYTYPSPCFADQVTSHYTGTTEVNDGVPGTCLEKTTVAGSLCNSSQSLILRYTTTMLPYAGLNSNWFFIMIGTNDIASATTRADTQVNLTTYRANLQTIVSALISAGTPANQIVLAEIPWGAPSAENMGLLQAFNSAVADVAIQNGTRVATTYRAMAMCPAFYNAATPGCMFDTAHPDNTGHANLAVEMEAANFVNAVAARNDYAAGAFGGNALINGITTASIATTGLPSLIGNTGSFTALDFATNSASAGNYAVIQTTNDSSTGAQARCFGVRASSSNTHLDFAVDCGSDGTGDGNVGVYNKLTVGSSITAGYLASHNASSSAGDLSARESDTCGKLILGGVTTSGAMDFGCTTSGMWTFSNPFFSKFVIGASSQWKNSDELEIQGPYNDFSGGAGGVGAQLNILSTTAAGQDVGAQMAYVGQTGNAFATYPFGGIKCAKQTASGDGNYGGYCAWYTTTDAGGFAQNMKLDKAGTLTLVNSNFSAPNGSAASCTGGYKFANGIMVISGSGAPTCTAPAASEYLRSDGASGSHIYISQGAGTWTAIAGV